MVASQTTSTPSVVKPRGRCSFDIINRTDLLTLAALDTNVIVNGKLLIRNHLLVEIPADDVRIESGGGTFFQFLDTTTPFLDHLDDMGYLLCCQFYLHSLLLLGIGLHERQTNITLRHDDREKCLCL